MYLKSGKNVDWFSDHYISARYKNKLPFKIKLSALVFFLIVIVKSEYKINIREEEVEDGDLCAIYLINYEQKIFSHDFKDHLISLIEKGMMKIKLEYVHPKIGSRCT